MSERWRILRYRIRSTARCALDRLLDVPFHVRAAYSAVALYAALRPSGRTLIRISWTGLDAAGRQIFAREIRGAIAPAWETAKREASDRGRQVVAAGGRIAMPVRDLTEGEIDLIKQSGRKKASGGEPGA
jgi:hypothetical protein